MNDNSLDNVDKCYPSKTKQTYRSNKPVSSSNEPGVIFVITLVLRILDKYLGIILLNKLYKDKHYKFERAVRPKNDPWSMDWIKFWVRSLRSNILRYGFQSK